MAATLQLTATKPRSDQYLRKTEIEHIISDIEQFKKQDEENWPSSFSPSTKMEDDDQIEIEIAEQSDQSWFGDEAEERPPNNKRKRGPGRPRKPDHELKRPRRKRENDGEEPRKRAKPTKAPAEKASTSIKKTRASRRSENDDQALIAAQQLQIEELQRQISQYEARIKILETHRGATTPPTPAMSLNHSLSSSHAHPPVPNANPYLRPATQYGTSAGSNYTFEREDSPLSVYSDLNLEELFEEKTPESGQGRGGVGLYERRGVLNTPSLVVVFKANPMVRQQRPKPSSTTTSEKAAAAAREGREAEDDGSWYCNDSQEFPNPPMPMFGKDGLFPALDMS